MMKIFGVSQSSGVERVLKIERGFDGIVLTLTDHVSGKERGRIKVTSDGLVGAIMELVPGGSIIEGALDAARQAMQLVIEVRRNEELLQIRNESGVGADIAVGLDNLQDGFEGVTNKA